MTAHRHIGIIMDGNGRWATQRGLPRSAGHRAGAERVSEVVRAARREGVACLTLYGFSSENWNRPPDEVHTLMELLVDQLQQMQEDIIQHGIRLCTIGSTDHLPQWVRLPLVGLMEASAHNTDMSLCLALSYDGRESIVEAMRAALRAGLTPDSLTVGALDGFLETKGLGPADLIIRTGREQRLSGFLTWESTYAELYFTETMWPDFSGDDFLNAVRVCAGRRRRFGRVTDRPSTERPPSLVPRPVVPHTTRV